MTQIANQAAGLIDVDTRVTKDDLDISFDYLPPGYGKSSPGGLEAIQMLARTEGILLEPVYCGKAAAGMIDHVRQGRFKPERARRADPHRRHAGAVRLPRRNGPRHRTATAAAGVRGLRPK